MGPGTDDTELTLREKVLYHQIHPAKLAVDIAGGALSTWLAWQHHLVLAAVTGFVPSIIITVVMLRTMSFTRQRDSEFGHYIAKYMTPTVQAIRLGGQGVAWVGAWLQLGVVIVAGVVIIVAGWTYGLPSWRHGADEA
jgi:hypothetical protein